jgi:hypothetical protein
MQSFKQFPYKLWEELYIQSFVTDRTKTICLSLSPSEKNGGRDINQQKLNSDRQQMTWTRKTIPHHQMKLMYGIRKIIYPKIADREYFPWPQFQGSKIVVKIKINNPFLFTFVAMCIIF